MPLVVAWQCPKTQKLFNSVTKYRKHLKVLARKDLAKKRQNKNVTAYQDWVRKLQTCVKSIEELEEELSKNFQKMVNDHCTHGASFHSDRKAAPPTIVRANVSFSSIRFSDQISNTHDCPKNGVTNWGRKPGSPTGYPGLSGRVTFEYTSTDSREIPSWVTDMFRSLSINTGSGGGGTKREGGKIIAYTGEYEVRIYAGDWPELLYDYMAEDTLHRLS